MYLPCKNTRTKLCHLLGVLGIAELTICLINAVILRNACLALHFVSENRMSSNPRRGLQPHDIELQRAPVISYEELLGGQRTLFQ